jgi:hypothetical protein
MSRFSFFYRLLWLLMNRLSGIRSLFAFDLHGLLINSGREEDDLFVYPSANEPSKKTRRFSSAHALIH